MGIIRFLTDEDFNHRAVRGIKFHHSHIDLLTAQEVGLRTASDSAMLHAAAEVDRIVLSHDERTMGRAARQRIDFHLKMPGLFLAPQNTPVGLLIAGIVLTAECSHENEWYNRIEYLPN